MAQRRNKARKDLNKKSAGKQQPAPLNSEANYDPESQHSASWWKDRKKLFSLAGIILLTFIVYLPSLNGGFTNWDDQAYVTENQLITDISPDGLRAIFKEQVAGNYHPLTMLSLALNYSVSELEPRNYHVWNLILHLLNTFLVFIFLYLLSGRRWMVGALCALLFGIHPMHVESVAWVAERKDVLYTAFFLPALIVWLKYLERRGLLLYITALLLFAGSLLSKPAAVTFPVILLLLDWYQQRKFNWRILLEKAPFFIGAVTLGIITLRVQAEVGAIPEQLFSFPQKFCFAAYGLVMYSVKLFVPVQLLPLYPYPSVSDGLPMIYLASPVILAIMIAAFVYFFRKDRLMIFGALFYVVGFALVLQLISVGSAVMADRYTYVPYLGAFFVLGMVLSDWWESKAAKLQRRAKIMAVIMGIMVIGFAIGTYQRSQDWKDSETLWTDAVEKRADSQTAWYNLGLALQEQGRDEEALPIYNTLLQLNPSHYTGLVNRGRIHNAAGRYQDAQRDYDIAISAKSTKLEAYLNRADNYFQQGKFQEALADYTSAGQYFPENWKVHYFTGNVYFRMQDYRNAVDSYSRSLQYIDTNADIWYNRGAAYGQLGDKVKALADVKRAQSLGRQPSKDFWDWLHN